MASESDIRAALAASGGDARAATRTLLEKHRGTSPSAQLKIEALVAAISADAEDVSAHVDATSRDEQQHVLDQMLDMSTRFTLLAEAIEDEDDDAA